MKTEVTVSAPLVISQNKVYPLPVNCNLMLGKTWILMLNTLGKKGIGNAVVMGMKVVKEKWSETSIL